VDYTVAAQPGEVTIAAEPGSAPVELEQHAAADEPPPPVAPQPGELSEREVDYTVAAQRGEVLRLGQPAVSADPDPEGPGPSSAPLKMAINAPTSRSSRTRSRRLARARASARAAAADSVASRAERFVGITYGGAGLFGGQRLSGAIAAHIDVSEPAGLDLEAHADASWGDRNLYSIVLLYGGGAFLHQCKKVGLLIDYTMEVEAVATGKVAEVVAYAREVGRAISAPCHGPTLIGTDNLANLSVRSGKGTRSKHFLRRYHVLMQRVAAGDVALRHVGDTQMAVDFGEFPSNVQSPFFRGRIGVPLHPSICDIPFLMG